MNLSSMHQWPAELLDLAHLVQTAGGRALLVGGCVRDALLNLEVKDYDVEVYGLEADVLEHLLRTKYEVITVGKSFGVFKLRGFAIDVSLPRRERKTAPGHKGFVVEGDPQMGFPEAASRRDFTINAIMADPLTGELIDPLKGCSDLEVGVLRHCSERFAEDPLRVLRAMQFVSRFEYRVAPETIALCAQLTMDELPPERVLEEWKKLLLKGTKPSLGLTFLRDCGWVRYFPELAALIDCKQDPRWHPEGDVWAHTAHCLDAFARDRIGDEYEDLVVGFGVLCHDLGKPATTVHEPDGRIRSPDHEAKGESPTRSFLARFTRQTELIEDIVILVTHHMRPSQLYEARASDSAVRRLARSVGRIDRLVRVVSADMKGRPPMGWDLIACTWLVERASALQISAASPKPLVQGRHLLALGQKPGPHFKPLLDACFEAQLEGRFSDEAGGTAYLDTLLAK
ncbi:MAG: polynucleotide adenylyltransferase [Verrucomicrobiota bacterium]|nr:polynucleotide adenylyltransferase [Verrucomicrobiota bacterium]